MFANGQKRTFKITNANVRFRWKADVKNNQLECPLYTESGRSDVSYVDNLVLTIRPSLMYHGIILLTLFPRNNAAYTSTWIIRISFVSWYHMTMKMHYCLSRSCAAIHAYIISIWRKFIFDNVF